MMTNKELYREFCKKNNQLPIFMMDWWLDAVCAGKEWDVMLCVKRDDEEMRLLGDAEMMRETEAPEEIVAAMPYLLRKRAWMQYILMPQQTQIGGIWMSEDITEDAEKVTAVCQQFARKLGEMGLSYYYQHYPIGSPAPQAMETLGFKAKERVTYRIEDLSDLDKVIGRFSKNKKRQLQNALSLHA